MDPRHHRASGGLLCSSQGYYSDCTVVQLKSELARGFRGLQQSQQSRTEAAEYRDNRTMLSSSGGLAIELTKSENSIGLTQLASRVDFAMHAETSNGDDLFAKVKGWIIDMITRLEEKASVDAAHKAFEAKHIFNSMHSEIEMMRYMTMSQHKDLYLTTSMISLVSRSWPEHSPIRCRKQHHQLQGDVEPVQDRF